MQTLQSWIVGITASTWHVGLESAQYVLLGFLMAGLIRGFLKPGLLKKHLGENSVASVVKAALLGVPIPLCSCGVTAAAGAIRKEGASKGATASFLIATPETGVDSISISYALLDPIFTVVRPVAAFITAVIAGVCEILFDRDAPEPPQSEGAGCCCASEAERPADAPAMPLRHRVAEGIRYAFTDLLNDIGPYLLFGLVLAGGISWMIPDGFFERYLGGGLLPMLVMLGVGIPLYVCATASTPIAAAMILKGLSPGAALVFLLAGTATNIATIGVVAKLLGKRAAVIYVGSIAVCSLLLGLLLNALYRLSGIEVRALAGDAHSMPEQWFSGLLFVLLIGLVVRAWVVMRRPTAEKCH